MEEGLHLAEIQVATHFFAVTSKSPHVTNSIYSFALKLVEYEFKWDPMLRKNTRVIGRVWGGKVNNGSHYRYPISLLPEFLQFLDRRGIPQRKLLIKKLPLYEPAVASFKLAKEYVPRGYQEEGINFSFNLKNEGMHSSLLMMPTGSGKTVTLLAFAARLGQRIGMFVAPAHFDSWVKYFKQYLNIPEEKVYEIRGSKSIRKLFALCEHDEYDFDATLFSMRTLSDFFTAYEEDPQTCIDLYGGTPFELWSATKIGLLGGDEVHENLGAVYWLHTFIHGPFHLGLSATMLHKDANVEARQLEIYPQVKRFDNIPLPKHVRLLNYGYYFENFEGDKIQMSFPRRTTFSQAAFEGSIMKNRKCKTRLLMMVHFIVEEYHLKRKNPGEKMALFFYRIDVVEEVVKYLRSQYPKMDIRRFIEDDPLSEILEAEITVTTVGKAGTGIDVPVLVTVYSFVNMDSWQKNIQLLGRLREPKPGESEKLFIQGYPVNIKKLEDYKAGRDKLFEKRIASRAESFHNTNI